MKKIVTLAFLSLYGVSGAFAQDFVYSPTQHIVDTVEAENFDYFQINITTPQPEAITFAWERISNTYPTAWTYSFCDLGGCYVGVPTSGEMNHITLADAQSGVEGFLKLNLTVAQNYGQGKLQLYVYDSNNYSRGDTVSIDLSWEGVQVGINELSENTVTLYPNPATDILNVNSTAAMNLEVFNLSGTLVQQMAIQTAGTHQINIADLPRGMYLLRGIAADGELITRRFTRR